MVGIPGKSKGCHTCRKRKIKVSVKSVAKSCMPIVSSATCSNPIVNGAYGVGGCVKVTIEVLFF